MVQVSAPGKVPGGEKAGMQTSVVLPAHVGEPFVQFIEPFLARREIRASYAGIGYGVDRRGRFADLLITVNGGVLYLQAKVA
jgi:hypothetical protein